MSGGRARLFVALDLPDEVRSGLFGWARERVAGLGARARVRVVEPESLHVTLCFLGSRPVGELDPIAAAARAAVSELPAAALTVAEALWLPPRRPRVLTVKLSDELGRLADVQSALAWAFRDGGFYEPDKRPFLAHVTVARVQREGRPSRSELPAPVPLHFIGDTVTVYRSRLGAGPARYEALASAVLQR